MLDNQYHHFQTKIYLVFFSWQEEFILLAALENRKKFPGLSSSLHQTMPLLQQERPYLLMEGASCSAHDDGIWQRYTRTPSIISLSMKLKYKNTTCNLYTHILQNVFQHKLLLICCIPIKAALVSVQDIFLLHFKFWDDPYSFVAGLFSLTHH